LYDFFVGILDLVTWLASCNETYLVNIWLISLG